MTTGRINQVTTFHMLSPPDGEKSNSSNTSDAFASRSRSGVFVVP